MRSRDWDFSESPRTARKIFGRFEQFARPETIANFCRAHFGQGSNNIVEFRHDGRSGGRDQLEWDRHLADRDVS